MKDHEIAHLVNELRGIANEYAGTDQLRGRISECVSNAVKKQIPVYEIGIRGQAYDPPGTVRAYTYSHQPGNVIAGRVVLPEPHEDRMQWVLDEGDVIAALEAAGVLYERQPRQDGLC